MHTARITFVFEPPAREGGGVRQHKIRASLCVSELLAAFVASPMQSVNKKKSKGKKTAGCPSDELQGAQGAQGCSAALQPGGEEPDAGPAKPGKSAAPAARVGTAEGKGTETGRRPERWTEAAKAAFISDKLLPQEAVSPGTDIEQQQQQQLAAPYSRF